MSGIIGQHHEGRDYWRFTYDQKRSGRNFLQTSVTLIVSTQCYTKEPWRAENSTHIRGAESTFQQQCILCYASSHPLRNSNKSTHYYILEYKSPRLGSLSLYSVQGKFCISCIKQWRINTFDTNLELHLPHSNILLVSPQKNTTMVCVSK